MSIAVHVMVNYQAFLLAMYNECIVIYLGR